MIDCEKPGDCAYPGCECQDDNDPFHEEPAMTQTPKPKLSDMSGYGADDVVILERKTYEELLAALKAITAEIKKFHGDFDARLFVNAETAIAKAEGR